MERSAISNEEVEQLRREIEERRREAAEREKALEALRELVRSLEGKNGALESALINHAAEIELLKRRLFGTKSERADTNEMQLLLGGVLSDLAPLQKALDAARGEGKGEGGTSEPPERKKKDRQPPTGRRDLAASKLPVITVELTDPELAAKGASSGTKTVAS
ncbi:MAG: transposase [Polyangiaceae bacterium]